MSSVRLRSQMNLNGIIRELDRMARLPDAETIAKLDATLAQAFATTQAFVHVQTGQLKASGQVRSEVHDGTYEAVISYGGGAAYYAAWEFSRDGHDPFADDPAFHAYEQHFEDVISDALD